MSNRVTVEFDDEDAAEDFRRFVRSRNEAVTDYREHLFDLGADINLSTARLVEE